MKTTVILDELNLSDVRPDPIAQRYAQLRRGEALQLLSNPEAQWCGRPFPTAECEPRSMFECDGLSFHECRSSGSYFASPVPDQTSIDRLARDGEASKLRREYFSQKFSQKQRDAIHAPMIRWIGDSLDETGFSGELTVAVVGNDDTGLAQAVMDQLPVKRLAVVQCVSGQPVAGAEVYDLERAPVGEFDLVVDAGSLERVSNPQVRIDGWWRLLAPGGFLAFTTNTASGLEYRLLGAQAPSFVALDRLTLYSVPALKEVLDDAGFVVRELSTPGRLDVELLENALSVYSGEGHQFWSYLLAFGSENMKAELQTFLQRHQLSSFARVFAHKPEDNSK
ncbi:MAG: hypothetical protein QUV02_10815 [Maricaulis sp.]|uniref:methyltransferase domain-containing protein n=1 Tax=Maricaulis sp. TaxID=1486257 RepID=UPI0026074974|nr:methyltransferase domain-containing protein [Maricaulis sp.]MDM7984934.1 hypothetical protein [Maricaulis sp.]